jgi:hypothetical protein
LVTLNTKYRDCNVIAYFQCFANSARKNQHSEFQSGCAAPSLLRLIIVTTLATFYWSIKYLAV